MSDDIYKRGYQLIGACDIGNFLALCERAGKDGQGPTLREFWDEQADWSRATFGPDSGGPTGALAHLAKEVKECQEKPDDIFEFADIMFLAFDSCRRAGFTYEQLLDAIWKKLEINKNRKWGPRVPGQPVEHIREGE